MVVQTNITCTPTSTQKFVLLRVQTIVVCTTRSTNKICLNHMVPQKNLLFVWTLSSTNFFNICLNSVEYKKDVFVLHVVQKKDMCTTWSTKKGYVYYLEYKQYTKKFVLPGVQTFCIFFWSTIGYKQYFLVLVRVHICLYSHEYKEILFVPHVVQTIFLCTLEGSHLFVLLVVQTIIPREARIHLPRGV